jgi:hypothetical protein
MSPADCAHRNQLPVKKFNPIILREDTHLLEAVKLLNAEQPVLHLRQRLVLGLGNHATLLGWNPGDQSVRSIARTPAAE